MSRRKLLTGLLHFLAQCLWNMCWEDLAWMIARVRPVSQQIWTPCPRLCNQICNPSVTGKKACLSPTGLPKPLSWKTRARDWQPVAARMRMDIGAHTCNGHQRHASPPGLASGSCKGRGLAETQPRQGVAGDGWEWHVLGCTPSGSESHFGQPRHFALVPSDYAETDAAATERVWRQEGEKTLFVLALSISMAGRWMISYPHLMMGCLWPSHGQLLVVAGLWWWDLLSLTPHCGRAKRIYLLDSFIWSRSLLRFSCMIESLWFVKARDAIGLSLLFLFVRHQAIEFSLHCFKAILPFKAILVFRRFWKHARLCMFETLSFKSIARWLVCRISLLGCTFEAIDLARARMMIEIKSFCTSTGNCSLKIHSLATTYPASLLSAPALRLKMSRILY